MKWMWWPLLLLLAVVVYEIRFAPKGYERFAEKRERLADSTGKPIEVAVVWPMGDTARGSFLTGAAWAESEINDRGGLKFSANDGVRRRDLRLRYFNESSTAKGIRIARSIATDADVVAVVGHEVRNNAVIKASTIYDASGPVFIVPTSINPSDTLHKFNRVFRLAPQVGQVGQAMVDTAALLPVTKRVRVAVLYPETTEPDRDVAERLERSARELLDHHQEKVQLRVVFCQGYRRGETDYRDLVEPLIDRQPPYDVVLILDVLPDAAVLRRDLERGLAAREEGRRIRDSLVLDLNRLDWSSGEYSYADPLRQGSDAFFERAAELVLREARQTVAVLVQRDSYHDRYGGQLGRQIMQDIRGRTPVARGFHVTLFRTYETIEEHESTEGFDYAALVAEVVERQVDFVFIAGLGESAVELIIGLRDNGFAGPIICGPHLEAEVVGDGSRLTPRQQRQTYVVTVFNAQSTSEKVREFVDHYRKKFGREPDTLAVAGYQSIKLLESAMQAGNSASPKRVAAELLKLNEETLFGQNHFNKNGDLENHVFVAKTRPWGTVTVMPLGNTDRSSSLPGDRKTND